MTSILNNVSALGASRQLGITGWGLQQTLQRLTTGQRINRASDDAAGLGIANKLGADIRIAAQGKRNANDGTSYLQVADGVLDEVTSLLIRASELAQQAQTGTISDGNRVNIDAEFQNILKVIIDVGQNTTFNGAAVFSSSVVSISVGGFSAVGITVGTISSGTTDALGLSNAGTTSSTTTTTTVTAAGSAAANAASAAAGSTTGYLAASAAANIIGGATALNMTAAVNNWLTTQDAQALAFANIALTAINAYVTANPQNLNGLAAQAAIQYSVSNPPGTEPGGPATQANNAAAAAAAAAASYSTTSTTTTTTLGDSLATAAGAASVATKLAAALDSVSGVRASLGASMQQLNSVSNSLGIQVENFTSAFSQIRDASVADEIVNLTQFQILSQSGTSALSQANSAQQQILALLR